jgi:hypothetical protein
MPASRDALRPALGGPAAKRPKRDSALAARLPAQSRESIESSPRREMRCCAPCQRQAIPLMLLSSILSAGSEAPRIAGGTSSSQSHRKGRRCRGATMGEPGWRSGRRWAHSLLPTRGGPLLPPARSYNLIYTAATAQTSAAAHTAVGGPWAGQALGKSSNNIQGGRTRGQRRVPAQTVAFTQQTSVRTYPALMAAETTANAPGGDSALPLLYARSPSQPASVRLVPTRARQAGRGAQVEGRGRID